MVTEAVDPATLGDKGEDAMGTGSEPRRQGDAAGDRSLRSSVERKVVRTIVDVVGEEFYEEADIGLDSTFAEDIELESMEMMEIAERLIETYGGKVDFVAWFAEMELEDLVEMTVGTVVDFIVESLEAADGADALQPSP